MAGLTDTEIKRAKAAEKAYSMGDGGGLYLWVKPTGGKLWRWSYRFEGKEKLMSLGKYPDVSLAQARERHAEARKLLATGVDPMAQRKAEKTAAESRSRELLPERNRTMAGALAGGEKPAPCGLGPAAHGGRYSALPGSAAHCGDRGAGIGGDGQRDSGSRRAGYCQTGSGDRGAGFSLRHRPRLCQSATRPPRFAPATF